LSTGEQSPEEPEKDPRVRNRDRAAVHTHRRTIDSPQVELPGPATFGWTATEGRRGLAHPDAHAWRGHDRGLGRETGRAGRHRRSGVDLESVAGGGFGPTGQRTETARNPPRGPRSVMRVDREEHPDTRERTTVNEYEGTR